MLTVPVLTAPVLTAPVGVSPLWLPLLPLVSLEVGKPVPDGLDVDGLALVGVMALGLAVFVGAGVEVGHGSAVASAVFLAPVALAETVVVASSEAVVVGLLVAVPVGVGVAVAVAVAVLVAVVLSLGLAVRSAGLLLLPLLLLLLLLVLVLVLVLAGLVAEPSGVTLGEADLAASCEGDGEGLDGHAVTSGLAWLLGNGLAWLLGKLLGLGLPAEVPIGWPAPSVPCAPLLLWEEVIPTAEPSWTKACRSGGKARATPMANTAQAAARPDRSKPVRQSRGWRRVRPGPAPGPPEPWPPEPCAGEPPRQAFQRRSMSGRKPPCAAGAPECLLA